VNRKLLAALKALPVALWAVVAMAILVVASWLRGRAAGRAEDDVRAADDAAIARIKGLKAAAAHGDDDEAQRQAFEGIRPRGGRRGGFR
jgi:hypothetical protein